jgi:flagellar hook-associated protein 2
VIGDIHSQFTVDPTTNTQGPLGSDSELRSLQTSLLADTNYSVTGNSGLVNLAALGISLNNDGTLSIDNTQLSNAFSSNPAAFQNFFQNTSSTGFANNFSSDLTNLTDPVYGPLNADTTENTAQQAALTDQISTLQTNLTAQQQALTTEYDTVNATLEEYPLLLQEVTAELDGLNGLTPNSTVSTTPTPPITNTAPAEPLTASATGS